MTARHLTCAGCSRRIGRRAVILVVTASLPLCKACAESPKIHARLFFACPENHSPVEHESNLFLTAGRAAQLINQPLEGRKINHDV
jgi:hypothetical protein